MENRVVIVGAGFSAPAGVPNQTNLLNKVLNLDDSYETIDAFNTEIPSDKEIIEIFLNHLFKNTEHEKISLEDLYTIIDQAILKKRNVGIFDLASTIQVRESLDRLISFIVNRQIKEETINNLYIPLYESLSEIPDLSFISLNWDFLLERILYKKNISVDYKIPLEVLPYQDKTNKKLHHEILKPHGSLNWQLCPICESIYSDIDFSTQNISLTKCPKCQNIYESSTYEKAKLAENNININQRLMPLLISPTFIKENNIPHLNFIFQEIYKKLIEADEIIFIGYSLPISDHDIRNLLIRANSVNSEAKVKVVLKEELSDIKNRLRYNYTSIYGKSIKFYWEGFDKFHKILE
jgi:NAD-dependent SIR2 family protein deacetylase